MAIPMIAQSAISPTKSEVVPNIAALDSIRPSRERSLIRVLGNLSSGDWTPKDFVYQPTNTLATNAIRRATTTGVGRWVHQWDGDPRAFGMKFGNSTTNDADANQLAFTNAIAWSRETGIPIKCPPGNTHIHGEFDVRGLNEISGSGHGGPAIQTSFIYCTKGATVFKEATTGMKFSRFWIYPMHLSWFRDDTSSVGIKPAFGESYGMTFEELEIYAFTPLWLQAFDYTVSDCALWGVRGLFLNAGGTQSQFTRTSIRGLIAACSTNSGTVITIPTYTAGTTNFSVGDGQPLRAGDIIIAANGTTPGYASSFIPQKQWGRRITAVSGNDITISHPWPTSFVNGQVYYLLGKGYPAILAFTGHTFTTLNVEWGSWDTIMRLNGPATYNIDSLHVEGWAVDRPGVDTYYLTSDLSTVNIDAMTVFNGTVLDSTGLTLCDQWGGYNINNLFVRDIDMFQATKKLFIAKSRSMTRSNPVRLQHINNYGVSIQGPTPGSWELQGQTMELGQNGYWQQRVGESNMLFYGYASMPTFGSFVAGDRLFLRTNMLTVVNSGTLGTPSGSNRIRINSRVLIPDVTARGFMGQRTVIGLGVGNAPHVVDRPLLGGPISMVLASNAIAGDRDVWVNITGSLVPLIGDWGIIGFGDATREDVQIQRTIVTTTPDRMHFSTPIANAYLAGTTLEMGTYLSTSASVDVPDMSPVTWPVPTFNAPLMLDSSGSFSASGSFVLGSSSVARTLRLIGGLGGARHMLMERVGVGTNSIGISLGTIHMVDETAGRFIATFSSDATTVAFNGGGNSAAGTTNGRVMNLTAPSANTSLTNESSVGGTLNILAGAGTGIGALSQINFQAPTLNNSTLTNVQPMRTLLTVRTPAVIDATTNNTGIILYYYPSATNLPVAIRMVITNEGGILRPIFVP